MMLTKWVEINEVNIPAQCIGIGFVSLPEGNCVSPWHPLRSDELPGLP